MLGDPQFITHADNALTPADVHWKQLADAATDILYLLSPDGVYLNANPRLCRLFHLPLEKVVGMNFTALLEKDHVALALRVLHEIVERHTTERSTRTFVIPDVGSHTFEVCESPLLRNGKVWAVAGIGREITQEVALEHHLWDREENRHAAVDFALRTSLGLMRGYICTLGRNYHTLSEERRSRYLRIIEEETEHLSRIVKDLLDVRRLEGQPLVADYDLLDLKEIVTSVVAECEAETTRRSITVTTDAPARMAPLYAPREAVVRIVENLVQNAIHHTLHSGHVTVQVQDHDAYVELIVTDDGVGIAENELPQVFDKYYRAQSNAASPMQGLGLGLYVTRLFVEALGGRITVQSRIGAGSEFRVVLPRHLWATDDGILAPAADIPLRARNGAPIV